MARGFDSPRLHFLMDRCALGARRGWVGPYSAGMEPRTETQMHRLRRGSGGLHLSAECDPINPNEFNLKVIRAIEALGSAVLGQRKSEALRQQVSTGLLTPRDFGRDISLDVYRLIAHEISALRGLKLGDSIRRSEIAAVTDAHGEDRSEIKRLTTDVLADSAGLLGSSYEAVLECEPAVDLTSMTLRLDRTKSHARKASGSYYTPQPLVDHLLNAALLPVLDSRVQNASPSEEAEALLGVRVSDPSCGPGRFLVPAARMIAHRLASVQSRDEEPKTYTYKAAIREVIRRCVFGVDLDPVAAELCRMALWIEADDPDLPLIALREKIRVGDALLGTTPQLMAGGIPDEAFILHEGDDPKAATQLRRRNRTERKSDDSAFRIDARNRFAADAWCAAFVWKKCRPGVAGDNRDDAAHVDAITHSTFRVIADQPDNLGSRMRDEIERLAEQYRFFHWHAEFPEVFGESGIGGFDVLVGNPPFLNQLGALTASDTTTAHLQQILMDGAAAGYSDVAGRFLIRSLSLCKPGGRLGFVQPISLLSAADAMPIRQHLAREASLTSVWVSTEHAFEGASVFTCAVALTRDGPRRGLVSRAMNTSMDALPTLEVNHDELAAAETWSPMIAAALGIPEFQFQASGTIGDLAIATADFRDQYYGLDGFLIESDCAAGDQLSDEAYPPIVTTGLIDLAECCWGERPTKLLKQQWHRPRVDRRAMEARGSLGPWIAERLVPKVMLATQTRVVEVFVDEYGRFLPSTPLISVFAKHEQDIWKIASALASPVISALALQRYAGAALTTQAIKLSAKQSLRLPLPTDLQEWERAAELLRRAHAADSSARRDLLEQFGKAGIAAFQVPEDEARGLLTWWLGRLK